MFQNIMGALGGTLNGVAAMLLAVSLGFGSVPTAMLFIVGGIGMAIFGEITPVLIQSELIVLAAAFGKDRDERLSICVWAGVITTILGVTGVVERVVNFIGDNILYGIMAGVGIMLVKVSFDMIKSNKVIGVLTLVLGIIAYVLTESLIYTSIFTIIPAGIVWNVLKRKRSEETKPVDMTNERFRLTKLSFHPSMLRASFAIVTLLMGGIISEAPINSALAGGVTTQFNAITTYAGIAGILSPLFGGAPAGVVITCTASAPQPILAGVLLMAVLAVLMLLKVVPRCLKILPSECVAGLLFTMGALVIFPPNAAIALQGNPIIGGVTMLIAALVDPFSGMVAGLAARYLVLLM
ncbi:MAG: hypothetical protein Q4B73_02720 [Lachnospiraceae bacterium]|nr:hypothetical protein [Lachnospiraceae bacterium]